MSQIIINLNTIVYIYIYKYEGEGSHFSSWGTVPMEDPR